MSEPDGQTYRALLVDYGGVLTSSVTTSFASFCVSTGVRPEALKTLLAEAYSTSGEDTAVTGAQRGGTEPSSMSRSSVISAVW